MKPGNLIRQLRKAGKPAPGYLFLGAEPFYRSRCRDAVRRAVLGANPDETAKVEIDLGEQTLNDLLEESRTLSLFETNRLVIGRNAEGALPRSASKAGRIAQRRLAEYFDDPVPGTTVLLEAVRYDSQDRSEKAKLKRVGGFFAAVPVRIDLDPLSVQEAHFIGKVLAGRMGLNIQPNVVAELVDMLGADAFRVENELEKLALFVGKDREVTSSDLELLVPEARQSGLFQFSEALAARDRTRALQVLDTMSRAGMYWPMQLNLIAGLFRQALAAKELGLRDARQIRSRLARHGLKVWPARSKQLAGIVSRFRDQELRDALIALFEADRGLRSSRPDDRVVVEMLVMKLTS